MQKNLVAGIVAAQTIRQSPEPMPRSDMENAQEYMDMQLNLLHERIDMLEHRLSPVLKPYPIGVAGENSSPAGIAPLVEFIGMRSQRIQAAHDHIDNLLSNLAI